MGFLITSQIELPNGLTAQGVQVSIGGSYQLNKLVSAMTQEPLMPAQYSLYFEYKIYKIPSAPITQQEDRITLESVESIDLFALIYTHLKAKFPDGEFVDN